MEIWIVKEILRFSYALDARERYEKKESKKDTTVLWRREKDNMTIEEALKTLNEKGIPAVVMVKANEGYSVIPMSKNIYTGIYLMQTHWNDKTIKKALIKLLKGELK